MLTSPSPTLRHTRKTESPVSLGSYLGQTKERPVIPHKILMEPAPQAARVQGGPARGEGTARSSSAVFGLVVWAASLFTEDWGQSCIYASHALQEC